MIEQEKWKHFLPINFRLSCLPTVDLPLKAFSLEKTFPKNSFLPEKDFLRLSSFTCQSCSSDQSSIVLITLNTSR